MMRNLNISAWTPIKAQQSICTGIVTKQALSLKHLLQKQSTSQVTTLTLDFTSEPWDKDLSTGFLRHEDHIYHVTNLLYQFSGLKQVTVIFPATQTLHNHHQELKFQVLEPASFTWYFSPNSEEEYDSLKSAECCVVGNCSTDNHYNKSGFVKGKYVHLEKGVHPDELVRTWVWKNDGKDILRPVGERKPISEVVGVCERR
jgi:hypothetical protein